MPQVCSICRHNQRDQIEQAMVRNISCRKIAALYRVSSSAVSRHRQHVPEQILGAARTAKDAENTELVKATDKLLAEIHTLQRRVKRSKKRDTVQAGDLLLKISREVRALLELRERLAPRGSAAQPQAKEQRSDDDSELLTEEEATALAKRFLASRPGADVPKTSLQRGSQVTENEHHVEGDLALSKSVDFGTVGAR